MIQHCVFLRFRPEVSSEERQALFQEIADLVGVVPGLRAVHNGANARFEDLDHGFADGFIAEFADAAALDVYQAHPAHKATGAKLVAAARGGIQGLLVFDLVVP